MRIRFLGSGDAFGSGGRFNTCIHLERARGGGVLIDCGASSLIAMRRWDVEPNSIAMVLISHLHGDHFGGLPFLILDAQLVSRRAAPLLVVGPPGLRKRLAEAMEVFFPGSSSVARKFAIDIVELAAEAITELDGLHVTPFELRHPCGAPPYALRVEAEGKTVTYSGDTEWVDNLARAARGADLFIAEAYFFDKAIKYHLDYATLRRHLPAVGAKRVVLTHMSAEMLGRLGEVAEEVAEDGKAFEL
jgi:ribonuclease BN (tRNA processing enzyme)